MKDENPFKEKLYQHTLPVSDALWGRIESNLPADKKRFPILLFALAVFIVVTAIVMFLSMDQRNPGEEKINPDRTIPPVVTPLSEATNPNPSDHYGVNNASQREASPIAIHETKAFAHTTNVNLHSHTKASGPSNHQSVEEQPLYQKPNRSNENYINPDYTPDVSAQSISPEELSSSSLVNLSGRPISSDINGIVFSHLAALSFDGINKVNQNDESSILNDLLSLKPDPSCYKFTGEEGKSNLSVDLFVTPGFAPRTFENTSDESILYTDARKETESSQYAWGAGGRVNLNLNKEFAVRLGFMYEQVGDIFDYTDTLATQRSTRIDSFFSADGTFLYAETNTVLIFGTLIKKIHNRYHHLDIPLLASYELCMGRAVIMLNAGPVINLTTSVRGQILNPGFVPQHISESETNRLDAYKSNIGLSLYLGAGALIPFNKYFSGLVEPRFLYRIKPVTNDDYPLKEHRHFAGINLGIRYHFD